MIAAVGCPTATVDALYALQFTHIFTCMLFDTWWIPDDRYMQCPTNLGGCGHEFCWLCRYVSEF